MSTGRLGNNQSRLAVIRLAALTTPDNSEIFEEVSSEIVFVQDVATNAGEVSSDSVLTFVSEALFTVDHYVDVESELGLISSLSQIFSEDVESEIAFVSDVVVAVEYNRSLSDTLTLVQDVHQNLYFGVAASVLAFVQSAAVIGPTYIEINQSLGLTDEADPHLSVVNKSVGSEIVFAQQAGRVLERSVTSTITFVSTGERRNIAEHTLAFVQSAVAGFGAVASSTLTLMSVVALEAVLNRDLSDELNFISSATYILDRACTEKEYTPFVGSGSSEFTPPPTTAPTLGSATLTLTYPYVTPSSTLVLRNPEFRNTDTLSFNRINRVTRGGTLVVFSDPDWPKTQTLRLECQMLKKEQADNLLDFFLSSLGQEIGLLDHENRQWRGIITTPDAEVAHTSRHNRTVSFDFEGELV